MKIGMLTQWYQPETGGAQLAAAYAQEFSRQGHRVRVLTGFPNYPNGKIYPGYRLRPRQREWEGAVRVDRVALYPNHSSSAIGRFLNYTSFGLSAATLGAGALRGADAIWVFNHPITTALPMLTQSKWGRVPIFLHVQDLWPDSFLESGMVGSGRGTRFAASVIAHIVRFTENRSAVVGVISPSVRELIIERNPAIDPEKIVYVPNSANETLFRPIGRTAEPGMMDFMYIGAVGEVQGLETLIEAASMLRSRRDIRITIVGDGIARSRLEQIVNQRALRNVRFLGRLPQGCVPGLMAESTAQLVSLADKSFLAYTTPSKIAALLASGVPVVAQIAGDGARMLKDSGAALVVSPGDANGLAEAIGRVADRPAAARAAMGAAGRAYYEENLGQRRIVRLIVDSLERVS